MWYASATFTVALKRAHGHYVEDAKIRRSEDNNQTTRGRAGRTAADGRR
jgi:hypothetical protein